MLIFFFGNTHILIIILMWNFQTNMFSIHNKKKIMKKIFGTLHLTCISSIHLKTVENLSSKTTFIVMKMLKRLRKKRRNSQKHLFIFLSKLFQDLKNNSIFIFCAMKTNKRIVPIFKDREKNAIRYRHKWENVNVWSTFTRDQIFAVKKNMKKTNKTDMLSF